MEVRQKITENRRVSHVIGDAKEKQTKLAQRPRQRSILLGSPSEGSYEHFRNILHHGITAIVSLCEQGQCDGETRAVSGKQRGLRQGKYLTWDHQNSWADVQTAIRAKDDKSAYSPVVVPGGSAFFMSVARVINEYCSASELQSSVIHMGMNVHGKGAPDKGFVADAQSYAKRPHYMTRRLLRAVHDCLLESLWSLLPSRTLRKEMHKELDTLSSTGCIAALYCGPVAGKASPKQAFLRRVGQDWGEDGPVENLSLGVDVLFTSLALVQQISRIDGVASGRRAKLTSDEKEE